MSDQLHGDDPRQLRPEQILGKHSQGPEIIRVRLTSALASGGNATAAVVDYTGAGFTVSTRIVTVYDAMSLKSGASGDYFWAIWNLDARRYEVLGDSGEKINFKNNDATEAPAYANMQITGVTTVAGVKYITVIKPDGSYSVAKPAFLLNGGSAVAASGTGVGYLAHEIPRRVLYNTADGTPAFGEIWGTYSTNEWKARLGAPGYLVLGDVSGGSFLGVKDVEVRAWGSIYKTGTITETTGGKNPVELSASGGQYNTNINTTAGNYKITILIPGNYLINAHLSVQNDYSVGPKGKTFSMAVICNAGAKSLLGATTADGSTYETAKTNLALSALAPMEVGDYVQMTFGQDDTTDQSKTRSCGLSVVRMP